MVEGTTRRTLFPPTLLNTLLNALYAVPEFHLRRSQLVEGVCEVLEFLSKLVLDGCELGDRDGCEVDCPAS